MVGAGEEVTNGVDASDVCLPNLFPLGSASFHGLDVVDISHKHAHRFSSRLP